MIHNKKFQTTDEKGQAIALGHLKQVMKNCTLTIDQHIDDYNPIDIYITAVTPSNKTELYAFECKHRQKYTYDYVMKNGAMLELDKKANIYRAIKDGYKGVYMMTFSDGYMIWVLNNIKDDIDALPLTYVKCPKTTVVDSGTKNKACLILPYSLCKYSRRLQKNN